MCEVSDVDADYLKDSSIYHWDRLGQENLAYKVSEIVQEKAAPSWKHVAHRIQKPSSSNVKTGCGGKVTYEWGGKDEPKSSVTFGGYVEDRHGNRVSGNFSRDDKGRNKMSAGIDYENKPNWESADE